MTLFLNTIDFDAKFEKITKKAIPELLVKGMGRAGLNLMNDAINEVPTVPLKEGTLRGSGSVFVNGQLAVVSPDLNGKGTPNREMGFNNKKSLDITTVGFNTPYAARMHEGKGIKNWTEPSSGKKFLENKISNNRKEYMLEVANTVLHKG